MSDSPYGDRLPAVPWGRTHLFADILWRWIVSWTVAFALFGAIASAVAFSGEIEGDSLYDQPTMLGDITFGLILGLIVGLFISVPFGLIGGAIGAALFVPYKGRRPTIIGMCSLVTVIAAAPCTALMIRIGWEPDGRGLLYRVVAFALFAGATSRWHISGYLSAAGADTTDAPLQPRP